jgi:hypothetical protein
LILNRLTCCWAHGQPKPLIPRIGPVGRIKLRNLGASRLGAIAILTWIN